MGSIHLITMYLAMRLLLVLPHKYFFLGGIFEKFTPTPCGPNPDVASYDLKQTSIHLITLKRAMRLLVVLPHRFFWGIFQKFEKFTPPLPDPRIWFP